MKAKPVRRKQTTNNPSWAYNVLEQARQQMGDDAFKAMVKQHIIDLNLKRVLPSVKGIDERIEIARQAHELRKGMNLPIDK